MKIEYAPKGVLVIDDANIVYRNFRGEGGAYNHEGDRNFALVIPDEETAEHLLNDGWNVKIKMGTNEEPFRYLPVKVKFNERGPKIYLKSGENKVILTEEDVDIIDKIDIMSVSMDIRPYDWRMSDGKSGRSAYLQAMEVYQRVDRFAD